MKEKITEKTLLMKAIPSKERKLSKAKESAVKRFPKRVRIFGILSMLQIVIIEATT